MRMVSTSDVLDRHLKSFAEYDLEGVLADYSSDAVLFVPTGPLKGPDAIKPLFQTLISEFAKPGSSFTMQQRSIEGDHAYILWTAETADNSYEFATDTSLPRSTEALNSRSGRPRAGIAPEYGATRKLKWQVQNAVGISECITVPVAINLVVSRSPKASRVDRFASSRKS